MHSGVGGCADIRLSRRLSPVRHLALPYTAKSDWLAAMSRGPAIQRAKKVQRKMIVGCLSAGSRRGRRGQGKRTSRKFPDNR
jgi:hypothetical protein